MSSSPSEQVSGHLHAASVLGGEQAGGKGGKRWIRINDSWKLNVEGKVEEVEVIISTIIHALP